MRTVYKILIYITVGTLISSLLFYVGISVFILEQDVSIEEDEADILFITDQSDEIIEVELATTSSERYQGLSDRDNLEEEGMAFLYNEEDERTFVMRDMDFGIDIIFVDENCEITDIYNAEKPTENETGVDEYTNRYTGFGIYVIEVPFEYTKDNNISESDEIRIQNVQDNSLVC